MEYIDYIRDMEIVEMRVEELDNITDINILRDTINRFYNITEFLKERVVHCDSERFSQSFVRQMD